MVAPLVIAGGAAAIAVGYEVIEHFFGKKKIIPPGVLPYVIPTPFSPPPGPPVAPHKVPGGTYVYTGPQAAPDVLGSAAAALAAVNPCDASNEQLVRNFQSAAGLAQIPGGAGWNSVSPAGTDGRYGHDVSAILQKYQPHAPPGCSVRPSWWGPPGTYKNNT
jgi:hypothetical protein